MNVLLYLAIIVFAIWSVWALFSRRKKKNITIVKLLCPNCDNLIAELTLPSEILSLLRPTKDQWMRRYYNQIKLMDEHLLVCPECDEITYITKKTIMGEE